MLLISTRCKLDRIEYRSNIFYLQRLNRTGNKSRKIFQWNFKWKLDESKRRNTFEKAKRLRLAQLN